MNKEMIHRTIESGIIGEATVVFGGAIRVQYGTLKDDPKSIAVGLGELTHPCAKQGEEASSDETYMGNQVKLVFPDLEVLHYFRDTILNNVEVALKGKIKEEIDKEEVK